MISGIYKIVNLINKKIYIGSAVNINKRWLLHKYLLKNNKHYAKLLQNSYNKNGSQNFDFQIIEECEKSKLIEREQYYIDLLQPEYNFCKIVAHTRLGLKHSSESIQKMKDAKGWEKHLSIRSEMIKKGIWKTNALPVLQFDKQGNKIGEYSSVKEAAKTIGINYGNNAHISECCNGTRKSSHGFIWKYK